MCEDAWWDVGGVAWLESGAVMASLVPSEDISVSKMWYGSIAAFSTGPPPWYLSGQV